MADPIQGEPGETSQTTAAETTQTPPAATETGAAETTATTVSNPAPEVAVDWDKVDAAGYERLKADAGEKGMLQPGTPAAEPAPESQTTQTPTTEGEQTKPPEQPAATATPEEEDTAPTLGEKYRPRLGKLPKVQQEAIQLVREMADSGKTIDLAEAEKRVRAKYGMDEPESEQPRAQAEAKSSKQIADDIEAKWEERKKAADNADLAKMNELDREIRKLEKDEQAAAQAEADAEAAQVKTLADTKAQLQKDYPQFKDETSALSKEFQRVYDELAAEGSPILDTAPEKQMATISKMAAANLGIRPVVAGTVPAVSPAASTLTNPPQRPVQPASGSARSSTPTTRPLEQRIEDVKTMDDYERLKAELSANAA